jgi:hypothetical protein
MRFVIFTHSLVSDWNNGNAHFVRGLASELLEQGCELHILEPADGWSPEPAGTRQVRGFRVRQMYPQRSTLRSASSISKCTSAVRLVLVHEWNTLALCGRGHHQAKIAATALVPRHTIGACPAMVHRRARSPALRRCTCTVRSSGNDIRQRLGPPRLTFMRRPYASIPPYEKSRRGGSCLIGNWEMVDVVWCGVPVRPVEIRLRARVFGVRYPEAALRELTAAGIDTAAGCPPFACRKCLPGTASPSTSRRPYVEVRMAFNVRPFEAMACGFCWSPRLARHGSSVRRQFLVARDGREMTAH